MDEKLKSVMIILSGSLNNAELYNRSQALMADREERFPTLAAARLLIDAAEAAEMM